MTDPTSDYTVSVTQECITRVPVAARVRRRKKFVPTINKATHIPISLLRWKKTLLTWRQVDDDHFAWIVSSWKNPGTSEGDEVFNTACNRVGWGSMLVITYFSSMTISLS